MSPQLDQQLITDANGKLLTWHGPSMRWERGYWILGALGIAASTLSASTGVVGSAAPYFAIVATLCYAFIGFMNPQKKANDLIRAYRLVDSALRNYRIGKIAASDLSSAMDQAESLLNGSQADLIRPDRVGQVPPQGQTPPLVGPAGG